MEAIPEVRPQIPRIIRAAAGDAGRAAPGPLELNLEDVQQLAERLVREAREKVTRLTAEARVLEESLAGRRAGLEQAAEALRAEAERDINREREGILSETAAIRAKAAEDGRAEGRAEGLAAGREEGYRKGFEEGYAKGREAGYREGREAEMSRIRAETEPLGRALTDLVRKIGERRTVLLRAVREELLPLAISIAEKVIKREVRECPEAALANVRKAIDLSFRRTALVVQVHPEDVALIEKYAPGIAGSFSGLTDLCVKAAEDVSRGGCRVVSSSGMVDLRIESQLELIEQALFRKIGEADPAEELEREERPEVVTEGAP
jgi:flagellar assembly protein FliH